MNEQTWDIVNSGSEIQPVVAALKQALARNLVAIVLFGSRARNEAGADSDMVWRWQKFPGQGWALEWGTAV
jgi:hypothetical protein